MALDTKDLEHIERLLFKSADDVAVSIARSFERLEERMDSTESRLYSRMVELEDKVEGSRQDLSDELGLIRENMQEMLRRHDDEPQSD
jgi:hypothetical protein